jgi:hypothetical protein
VRARFRCCRSIYDLTLRSQAVLSNYLENCIVSEPWKRHGSALDEKVPIMTGVRIQGKYGSPTPGRGVA